ncbi:hypothetical protein [Kribbella deserti]|uniref:DUF222 domain-containing protein n=1 Tax=Kribbella deserti TaxID=1926257 RepID=A0ABV6QTS1_9ACTN
MDATDYDELAGRLQGLLIRLDDRLGPRDQSRVLTYIEANELALALNHLAVTLAQANHRLALDERADLLALATTMGTTHRVSPLLDACPSSHTPYP